MHTPKPVIAVGHICLDIVPRLDGVAIPPGELIQPGKLIEVGAADLTTGGSVANTGIALHRLGLPVRLLGKVGGDALGQATLDVLRKHGEALTQGMIVSDQDDSSYTVVVNLPGFDRSFLHFPGANHTFSAADVRDEALDGGSWMHFGYPPLMQRMHRSNGADLCSLLNRAHAHGLATSLDMAHIDPASPAGGVDWRGWLTNVLPLVDFFLPSIDESLAMVGRSADGRYHSIESLRAFADELLAFGPAVVGLKLGESGFYLRSSDARPAFAKLPGIQPWTDAEVHAPCFEVDVHNATGAGDCTIAGFIAAVLRGESPEEAATAAVAVGAASVESADGGRGLPQWCEIERRIRDGWARR